jgi:hypothetical protein
MTALHPQYIVNQTGEKVSVILPLEEYNNLIAEAEEQEDIRQYKLAKKGPQEFIEAKSAFEEPDTMIFKD